MYVPPDWYIRYLCDYEKLTINIYMYVYVRTYERTTVYRI